ncbi:enoyl-CoA hydratase/isomerase family protein [Arenibaculum pallidiluteum]|uniref:enoyl-CoA hydratase/isomerase family protein n=1 Tax=Arenibaculum pallidiluteum TaxID=2812559 RepID=UPI001A972F70|nr:enoyl-CoA hydratase/isomerase family protein [Arenibaculum pallidiluteum]
MTDEILFERRGALGLVTLNRPKALNALNLAMIRAFSPRLRAWAEDPAVRAVVVRGAGDRAFCAGGDVLAVWEDGMAARRGGDGAGALTRDFFREEYLLNHCIHHFPKPYVAVIDGITMGGGVGLSVHGSHRIATERTLFAMPETGIGLFPDVGGSWFLPRCPGRIGTYLALTGARLGAADLLHTGIATAYLPSEGVEALLADLEGAELGGGAPAIDVVVARHRGDPGPAAIAENRAAIDRCFGFEGIEEIIDALQREGTDWAKVTLTVLSQMSPTSLKVTLRQLRIGAGMGFDDAMRMEYRLSQACMRGHDFYEGIRAVLVDKDKTPKWQPATLEAVDDALVESHFAPLGERDLSFGE